MRNPVPGKHLLIASTGGHLAQLVKWAESFDSSEDSLWVTFDTPQSRSLLRTRRVLYVPYVRPRDLKSSVQAFREIRNKINWRSENFTAAISTGAAVAVGGLLAAHLNGVQTFYIESVSRVQGPSLSGRIISLLPGINLSCQYKSWANSRWQYRDSLFENYKYQENTPVQNPRLFVTLGTISPYRFDALIDSILESGLANQSTVWQVGCTHRLDLPGQVHAELSADEFTMACHASDVVVTHSGVGTIMNLLDMGISPLVVPRRKSRNEHVDDHQTQIANLIDRAGIATVAEVDALDRNILISASGKSVQLSDADVHGG
ncbi:glycosyltransferase [Rhodococcus globerulus]|uniref:Glycosyltransferase n=1 Tax=Rhodococcus globerulus TaxID=33008 RepID=A0ABU4BR76_RHOGO|nr:glycosyltransferase [Rhodococcus globerulus]MDV6266543.1 glycosyltransferase [Rhodococcus globerulus]